MSITYKENIDGVNFKDVTNILKIAFGHDNKSEEDTAYVFAHSTNYEFAYDGDRLIGVARAISDGYEWAGIYNIGLLPDYQGTGIGKELIRKLMNQLQGQHIFLYTHPRTVSLYEHLGFHRSKTSFTYVGEPEPGKLDFFDHSGFFLPEGYRFEEEFYKRPPFIDNGKVIRKSDVKEISYSDSPEGIDYEKLNEVLSKAFGNHPRDVKITRDVFTKSGKVEYAFADGELVGAARAITDGREQAIILNVAVDPAYQGLGIGWNIVVKLAEQLKGYFIFLNTHPGAVGFYNRHGFRRNKTALCYNFEPMPEEIAKGFELPSGYRYPDEYANEEMKYYKGRKFETK